MDRAVLEEYLRQVGSDWCRLVFLMCSAARRCSGLATLGKTTRCSAAEATEESGFTHKSASDNTSQCSASDWFVLGALPDGNHLSLKIVT